MTAKVRSILREKSQCITLFVKELSRILFIYFLKLSTASSVVRHGLKFVSLMIRINAF
jgi:hypothetical protein